MEIESGRDYYNAIMEAHDIPSAAKLLHTTWRSVAAWYFAHRDEFSPSVRTDVEQDFEWEHHSGNPGN